MRKSLFAAVLVVVAAASAVVVDAVAGDQVVAGIARRATATASAARHEAASRVPPQQLYLARSALASLADANRTGNYSVLRDGAAPQLQGKYSVADLAAIFAEASSADRPRAGSHARAGDVRGDEAWSDQLRLAGSFLTGRERLKFTLMFAAVAGHWRIADLAIAAEAVGNTVTFDRRTRCHRHTLGQR